MIEPLAKIPQILFGFWGGANKIFAKESRNRTCRFGLLGANRIEWQRSDEQTGS